jgi:hypothetical protein
MIVQPSRLSGTSRLWPMTSREYRFFRTSHADQEGWLLAGAPLSYYPLGAMGVAHDILEHSPDDRGSALEEFMALGAALYIRGDGSYWSYHRDPPAYHIAGDIVDVLARGTRKYGSIMNEESMEPVPRTRYGEPLDEVAAKKVAYHVCADLDMSAEPDATKKAVDNAVLGVKYGYRLAQKRYGKKIWPVELTKAFQHIEGCVEALDLEHQEMKVIVDCHRRLGRIEVQVYDDFGDLVTPVERRWR